MEIVNDFPPNYGDIEKAFPAIKGKKIAYCWGEKIFIPVFFEVPPEVIKHESVHRYYQGGAPGIWWDIYLKDAEFRLDQELLGHQAQYQDFCSRVLDRNKRHVYLHRIATFLASPIYGSIITQPEAMKRIAG